MKKNTLKKRSQNNNSEPTVIDFGTRKISNQNFSKMIALPKDALRNCGDGAVMAVSVKLVQENGEQYLKLIPVCSKAAEEAKEMK